MSTSPKTCKTFSLIDRHCASCSDTQHSFITRVQASPCPTFGHKPLLKQRLTVMFKGLMWELIVKTTSLSLLILFAISFEPFTIFYETTALLKCLLMVRTPPMPLWLPVHAASSFPSSPSTAVCTPPLTPTELTSHSCYHTQQCLTKTLACTSQPQPQWLKHTAVRRQAGCNLQELLIQGNTQGVGQRD